MKKTLFAALISIAIHAEAQDYTVDKKYYSIEYSSLYKGATRVTYTLERGKINAGNLKKRPGFYTESKLPKYAKTHSTDYANTGFDRGHLASDASFDWSKKSQKSTYSMANIVPQLPKVNRSAWLSVEKMERYTARQFPTLDVVNIVEYKGNKILEKMPLDQVLHKKKFKTQKQRTKYIKKYKRAQAYLRKKGIRIPTGFYKILRNKQYDFQECYYVPNNAGVRKNDHRLYEVDCKKALKANSF